MTAGPPDAVAVAAEYAAPPPPALWLSLGRIQCLPPRCAAVAVQQYFFELIVLFVVVALAVTGAVLQGDFHFYTRKM